MDSRRDVLGCSRKEKNGSTTSKKKTATTKLKTPFPENKMEKIITKKAHRGLFAPNMRKKNHQAVLDTKNSFRDGLSSRAASRLMGIATLYSPRVHQV
jgi:hypothetical protein